MNKNSEIPSFLNSTGLVYFSVRWRKPLISVSILAIIISSIISSPVFIKPKYKSTAILFPTTTNSVSKALLNDNISNTQDILEFGEETAAEQMLQVLNSDDIRTRIIKKFRLMNHYDIDSTSKYPYTRLFNEYKNNITFERTEFMSVKIEVYDTDAQMAADITNDISNLLDTIKSKIQKERALQGLKIIEREYNTKLSEIKQLEDTINKLRARGMFDYYAQSAALSEEYTKSLSLYNSEKGKLNIYEKSKNVKDSLIVSTKARIEGAHSSIVVLEEQVQNLAKMGGVYNSYTEVLGSERKLFSGIKEKYDKAKIDVAESLSHKFVVNKAVKAEKSSYPIRWLIVFVTTLSSLLLCSIVIIAIEHAEKFSKKSQSVQLEPININ
jgi:capsular polysaccharide biosynthesis protein